MPKKIKLDGDQTIADKTAEQRLKESAEAFFNCLEEERIKKQKEDREKFLIQMAKLDVLAELATKCRNIVDKKQRNPFFIFNPAYYRAMNNWTFVLDFWGDKLYELDKTK